MTKKLGVAELQNKQKEKMKMKELAKEIKDLTQRGQLVLDNEYDLKKHIHINGCEMFIIHEVTDAAEIFLELEEESLVYVTFRAKSFLEELYHEYHNDKVTFQELLDKKEEMGLNELDDEYDYDNVVMVEINGEEFFFGKDEQND